MVRELLNSSDETRGSANPYQSAGIVYTGGLLIRRTVCLRMRQRQLNYDD